MRNRSGLKMTYAPHLNRAALTGRTLLDQMADDMRVLAANAGAVDRDDLETLGYTPEQITAKGREAARLANARAAA
jgi:hypothetical protein